MDPKLSSSNHGFTTGLQRYFLKSKCCESGLSFEIASRFGIAVDQLSLHCGTDTEKIGVAAMASSVSCVGMAGLLYSPGDFRTTTHAKAEIVPSVSLPKNVRRRQQFGLRQEDCFVATMSAFNRRTARLSSVSRKAGAPGDDDEPTKRDAGVSETKFDDTVDEIQKALGKSFGGPVWFAILLTLLAFFGGGYVYLIYNYADFSDIPILKGPQGL